MGPQTCNLGKSWVCNSKMNLSKMPHIQGAIYNLESTFRIIVSSNFLKTCEKSIVTLISKCRKKTTRIIISKVLNKWQSWVSYQYNQLIPRDSPMQWNVHKYWYQTWVQILLKPLSSWKIFVKLLDMSELQLSEATLNLPHRNI